MNKNLAQNSLSKHSESICSRVEIVREHSSDFLSANIRMEQDKSSFQQENPSLLFDQESNDVVFRGFHDIQDVDIGMSDRESIATPSSSLHYVGLRNLLKICYINVLLRWLLPLVTLRNSLLEHHLDVDTKTLLGKNKWAWSQYPKNNMAYIAQGFLELQFLCHEMLSSKSPVVDPQTFINVRGISHNQSDCCYNA